ncbi:hypothetical protein FB45DRAFT_477370 [Roridomyces roridus]|uniref:F-box domain-containing protein n=1 Tax=Roridomyces roridus TaxID=1738132 RepID=A0AAD7BZN7_9AGAR|nr:hypothetical protein FB45DRAFT_477370 [Roridomyces roridus]
MMSLIRAFRKLGLPKSNDDPPCEGPSSADQVLKPTLPPEIWHTILGFVIRHNGRKSIALEDPFLPPYTTESSPLDDIPTQLDRSSVPLVCHLWRSIAAHIIPEYLRIRSIPQLGAIVRKLEDDPSLGECVQRIDFQIAEPLTTPVCRTLIPRLLRRTPSLMIYVNQNGSDFRPETRTPPEVIKALAESCGPSLKRLEWSNAGEAPAWCDLADLCQHAPNLRTLRLSWIFSYEQPLVGEKPNLPCLETLSLGLIPDPIDNIVDIPITWSPLLDCLTSNPHALPSLRRFDIEIFPADARFFKVHGAKIRTLRTTNWSRPPKLPATLPLLSNLDTLVLAQSTEYVTFPRSHPTLRRICIAPFMEEHVSVPRRLFNPAVLRPLDSVLLSIDGTKLPALEEVRLRNIGILTHIVDEPAWLLRWYRRWSLRNVKFLDMHGRSFGDIKDPDHDVLLNSVRG